MNIRFTKQILLVLFVAFLSFTLSAVNATAQSGTASVAGTVFDQQGGVIAGATVKLSNPSKGFERTTVTTGAGTYSFPTILPGTYSLEITAQGFKKSIRSDISALVDTRTDIDVTLQAGDVTAVVNITSNTIESVVNTQDASLGNNFVPRQITQLPIELGRVVDLLSLQPGVTREGYVLGGRSDQANVTLDGVDINDQQNGGRTDQFQTSQDTVLRATSASVEEFRITTTNANANQGRSSGAQISLITKGGTNDFKGTVFYTYRPTRGSANTFFNNLAKPVVDRPTLSRHVYGGAIGGPIKRDKLFFFYSYEGQNQTEGSPVCQVVPLAHMGQGQMKFVGLLPTDPPGTAVHPITLTTAQLNAIYPIAQINPAAVAVFASAASRYVANSDCAGDGVNTGGFRWNAPTTTKENTHIARFDWNLNNKQSIFFRGNYQFDKLKGISAFPDTTATSFWDHPYGFVAAHNWTISNSMVNNFRYGLTRQAFSTQGDSSENSIGFRFVYFPKLFARTLGRITPTHNFTDDFSLIKGDHTFQFGGNVRLIRNQRVDYGNAYDDAVTNPSFYDSSGRVVDLAVTGAGYTIAPGYRAIVQNAATALIGRFSQYSGNFTFDINGNVVSTGTPTNRNFATEEYDGYVLDIWKPARNLTLTLGLRYGVSRPVYEKNGYQVVPKERLGNFFDRRVASSNAGRPLNDLIQYEKAGPANNGQGFYSMDWNNWQPRVAAAWSPNFGSSFLRALFGKEGESVIRGGFAITNDHFGGQLAVSFDQLSLIGFTSSTTISANTYNVTTRLAPQFTGFGQNIRALPGIPAPVQRFSVEVDPNCLAGIIDCPQRIEVGLDGTIVSPTHYTWNASVGRQLPWSMYIEASYVGRKARHLLAARDVMALNNLVDPRSGMDWYTAAGRLHDLRAANTNISAIQPIPYFENMFPGLGANFWGYGPWSSTQAVYQLVSRQDFTGPLGICAPDPSCDFYDILDWTFVQLLIDDYGIVPNMFFHPQFAALSSYSSVAYSDFHGATVTLRQRLGQTLSFDINYTWSKSFDNASGLQTGASYGSQFILNPLRPDDNYALSDFDVAHVINSNFIFEAPFGRGRKYFSGIGRAADAVIGGWQLSGIYRWNTGRPVSPPFDAAQWATNWNVQSNGVRVRPVDANVVRSTQNFFADPRAAYNSFRNARPGETGERNTLRLPGYSILNLSLAKSFKMPWREGHELAFSWQVFNVFNAQYFSDTNYTRSTWGLQQDSNFPALSTAPTDFGLLFQDIQGSPRRMQFGLGYRF